MVNASVDFVLNDEETLNAEFEVTPDVTYEAVIDLSASTRNHDELSNRDLPDQHPTSAITGLDDTLTSLTDSVSTIEGTIETYGDVVTHNADEFATAEQGALADTALQAGDNVSELVNDAGYLRASSLNGYATEGYVNAEIGNITDILDSYGNIVTHNVNEFATAAQGAKADTALQSGDNISELTNDANYATESFVEDKIEDVTDTFGDIVTHNVSEFATSAQGALADTALQPNDNISELNNDVGYITSASLPTVNNGTLTIQKNGSSVGTFTANQATNTTVNMVVPTQASDIGALPSSTKYGASLALSINSSTYVITAQLKDQDGNNLGSAQTIDLPLESVVVSGSYDDETKKIILTLQNGSTVEFSVADLVSGLQSEITADNMLDADLVDDSTSTNKFVTSSEKSAISTAVQPSDLATVATSGDYDDLLNKPTIPTVNDATLTIQKNGVDVQTFTANQSTNATANITVPTDTSDLTNGAGFITGITSGDVTTALGYTPYSDANPSGYISGITSGDVTTALGYTPYNSTNPNGYITATALNGYATQTWVGQQGYLTSISSSDVTSALGYTPANDSNVVKTSGDQTIADKKRFTGSMQLGNGFQIYAPNLTKGTLPASTVYKAIFTINDSTYNSGGTWQSMRLAVGEMSVDTTGKVDFYFGCYKFLANDTSASLIHCIFDTANNYRYVTVPAPAGNANGSEAVTASWVNGKLANYVTTNTAQTITSSKTFTAEQKFKSPSNTTTNGLSIAPYTAGGADIGLRDTSNNWLCKLYFNYNGTLQLKGTSVTSTTPTEDTTSSIQVDTVGARNTKINSVMNSILPTGSILPYGGSSAPTGFLLCDGSAVSRTDYADLFDVIGTTYGSGDGSTTFNLPNLSTAVLPSTSTVDVMGNGNALAIVDDLSTEAKQHNALVVGSGSSSFSTAKVPFAEFNLANPLAVGNVASNANEFGTVKKALGVSTLPQWSGLTGSITGVTLNYIIRT